MILQETIEATDIDMPRAPKGARTEVASFTALPPRQGCVSHTAVHMEFSNGYVWDGTYYRRVAPSIAESCGKRELLNRGARQHDHGIAAKDIAVKNPNWIRRIAEKCLRLFNVHWPADR